MKKIFLLLFTIFSILPSYSQSGKNMISVQVKVNNEIEYANKHLWLQTVFTDADKGSITFYSSSAEFKSSEGKTLWSISWPYEYPTAIYIDNITKKYLLVSGNIIRELSESGKIGMTYFASFENLGGVRITKFMTDPDKIGFQFYSSLYSGGNGGDPGIIVRNGSISWKRGVPDQPELCVFPDVEATKTRESDYKIPEGVLIKEGSIPFISTPSIELGMNDQYERIKFFQIWKDEFHWATTASPNGYWNSININLASSESYSSRVQTSTPFDYDKPIQVSINGIFKNKLQFDWILPDKTKGSVLLDISDCPIANELIVPKVVLKHPNLPYNSAPIPGEFAYINYTPKNNYGDFWEYPKFYLEWRDNNLCLVLHMIMSSEGLISNYWSKRVILFSSNKRIDTSGNNYDVWNLEPLYSTGGPLVFTLSKNQNIDHLVKVENEIFLTINSVASMLFTLKNEKELIIRNITANGLGEPWFKGSLKRFEDIISVQANIDCSKILVLYLSGNVDIYNVDKNKGLAYFSTFNIYSTNPKNVVKFDNSIIKGFPIARVFSTVNLRIRASKSLDSEILTTIAPMAIVQILEKAERIEIDGIVSNWVKIQLKNGVTGWCFGGYLEFIN